MFNSLNHVDVNLTLWFLIKSSYYIVPIPSTVLNIDFYDIFTIVVTLGIYRQFQYFLLDEEMKKLARGIIRWQNFKNTFVTLCESIREKNQ